MLKVKKYDAIFYQNPNPQMNVLCPSPPLLFRLLLLFVRNICIRFFYH
jgi:hypothetical protein